MVLINKAINEVTVKLVYYGPGLCGKTTNLEKIYGNPKLENKGKMISMSTETDRTLFFDFMPMELGTIAGQKVRVQLYTVPGQVFYDATRKLVLRGADGVVFVADSQDSMRDSNLESLDNLKTNLRINGIDPEKIALVYQYNKRDLPNTSTVEEMTEYLRPGSSPVVEASAISGVGVTATLRAAVSRILDNLKKNVDTSLRAQPESEPPVVSAVPLVEAKVPIHEEIETPVAAEAPFFHAAAAEEVRPPAQPLMQQAPFSAAAEVVPTPELFEPDTSADVFEVTAEPVIELDSAPALDDFQAVAVDEIIDDNLIDIASAAADAVAKDVAPLHSGADAPRAAGRAALETLLENNRAVVRALEAALERAREAERAILDELQQ